MTVAKLLSTVFNSVLQKFLQPTFYRFVKLVILGTAFPSIRVSLEARDVDSKIKEALLVIKSLTVN